MIIRKIQKIDNKKLAEIIKNVFLEHDCAKSGTVYTDPTTNHLFELFQEKHTELYVAEEDGQVLGCCGIYPTVGLPGKCTELVKFYLAHNARGKGVGKKLMQQCEKAAKNMGYNQIYIESLPEFSRAVGMYEKSGYKHLNERMGESGHFGCDIWMIKEI